MFYLAEIVRQATYALAALEQAMQVANPANGAGAWPYVQSFLTAIANVSKLLWPVRAGDGNDKARWRKFRGERLRAELEVSERSILQNRDVRNSADHFDERLDDLVRDQAIPESWTAAQDVKFAFLPAPFRAIDVGRGEIIAGHDAMAFAPVVDELKVILERCAEVEPRAIGRLDVAAIMAALRWPPLPSVFSPSERPDEPITTGVDLDRSGSQTLEELVALVSENVTKSKAGASRAPKMPKDNA